MIPVLQELIGGEWIDAGTCGDAHPENRCAGCTEPGHPMHLRGLRYQARARAGLVDGVLPTRGARATRVLDDAGAVVVEHHPMNKA